MHTYIYDSFVNQQKYNKLISKIEIRITDLGLNGKIIRLGLMSSLTNIIENELNKNAKTIIIVGDNIILHQAINSLANISKKRKITTPLAFIPIGKNNTIAKILGLTSAEEACNILSARRKETLDLGLINNKYFLTEAFIDTENTKINIDENYSIEITKPGNIRIINITDKQKLPIQIKPQANDNILELYIESTTKNFFKTQKETNNSLFSFSEITILNSKKSILIDQQTKISCPAKIKIAPEKIDFIVGKNRLFYY